ncbi:MAG: glycosyltransferase family 1 protein [Chloroflexota bacterium]|nr:MAG: glycosyltransferase family 1 protein [Chloroflexota bacterium]
MGERGPGPPVGLREGWGVRVGINGFFLSEPMTGSGQYTIALLRELRAIEGRHEFLAYDRGPLGRETGRLCALLSDPHRSNPAKLMFEQVGVPLWCCRNRVDLLHVPYFAAPLFGPRPTVVTVHDLIMLALPEYRGSPFVRSYMALACAAARRASLLIADSICTQRDIIRFLHVPEERIRVIPLAVDGSFCPTLDRAQLESVRRRYGLSDNFVFYIGGLDRRKNVSTLVAAWRHVDGPYELAVAGRTYSGDRTMFPDLERAAFEAGVTERVRFLGLVPEEDKPYLYAAARLFVFPSLYEGFGLTPLEAMRCGTPVVCSNSSSLPEVVGDAAELCDPHDARALAETINRVLRDPARQEELRARGLARAGQFSWSRVGRETLAAYKEVSNGR